MQDGRSLLQLPLKAVASMRQQHWAEIPPPPFLSLGKLS